ncbi:MAG: ATP synthase F1 subunit delta [Sedimentisphaerales bacterium]|nr:ATP synthase F1 subunit delta [Sedimentisphaerales bacterium]
MASDRSQAIARLYAEALFEIAREREQAASIRQELSALAELIRQNDEWRVFLETPALRRETKAETLAKVFQDNLSDLVMDFLMVVARKDRLALLGEIEQAFGALDDQAAGRLRGTITTAIDLDKKEQARLAERISRALRQTVTLENRTDPAILGGMILAIEDTVIDGSVYKSLRQYARQIKRRTEQSLDAGRILTE